MGSTLTGDFRFHTFSSKILNNSRDVVVYLPPGYDLSRESRFPVLYMHDGQNLFDAATSFAGEWGLDETAQTLIYEGQVQPMLIVGVYNKGVDRMAEYTPVKDWQGRGGKASAYGRMLVRELKPFIDSEYRTLSDPFHTGLGGSSLGGLVSLYLGLRFPNVFGRLLVMSPSVWWADKAILKQVSRLREKTDQKIWLDIGDREDGGAAVAQVEELCKRLLNKGWLFGQNLALTIEPGAEHNEQAWGRRAAEALRFLFPANS